MGPQSTSLPGSLHGQMTSIESLKDVATTDVSRKDISAKRVRKIQRKIRLKSAKKADNIYLKLTKKLSHLLYLTLIKIYIIQALASLYYI